jgi:hypothetical protein
MKRHDIELLSAYLDGELKSSDLAKMETRLKSDPELESAMNGLRATRTLLRRLPTRKAPRNFTLTRNLVEQNPPLPRTYPIFRLATVVATLLFFFTIGITSFANQMNSQDVAYGIGGGSGGGGDAESSALVAPALEEPAAPAPEEPETYGEAIEQATEIAPTVEALRIMETPSLKTEDAENVLGDQQVAQDEQRPALSVWQIGLAIVALVSILLMGLMRELSARRWK